MKESRRPDYGDMKRIQEGLDSFDSLADMPFDVCCAEPGSPSTKPTALRAGRTFQVTVTAIVLS